MSVSFKVSPSKTLLAWLMAGAFLLPAGLVTHAANPAALPAQDDVTTCQRPDLPVATPLTDLGANEYVRMSGGPDYVQSGPTGFTGGLYPGGSNLRPQAHTAAGIEMTRRVVPRDPLGEPSPNGVIAMISVGMSNTTGEYQRFLRNAQVDPSLNPRLVIVNTAQPGKVADNWADPQDSVWQYVDDRLARSGVADPQVQVAWIKLTNIVLLEFPRSQYELQADIETILRLLKEKFPNLSLAYFSSRTRSYTYWQGLNPEPGAYETGFAVKWLVEKQINGDPSLNFDPSHGPELVPYLSWGPYLWADGGTPRSDGFTWLAQDMAQDCTHPSTDGKDKVADLLMDFFKQDVTSRGWFLANPPPVDELAYRIYVPDVIFDYVVDPQPNPVRPPGASPLKR